MDDYVYISAIIDRLVSIRLYVTHISLLRLIKLAEYPIEKRISSDQLLYDIPVHSFNYKIIRVVMADFLSSVNRINGFEYLTLRGRSFKLKDEWRWRNWNAINLQLRILDKKSFLYERGQRVVVRFFLNCLIR